MIPHAYCCKKQGFTFLELALVLAVIGLIVGAVVAGQNIIASARLNSMIADTEKYRSAALQFKQKYRYLPGDFPGATALWGTTTAPACTAVGAAAVLTTPTSTTCNGSGNGVIGMRGGTSTEAEQREGFLMWQHLTNAGFITGQYSGFPTSTTNTQAITLGVNVPSSKTKPERGFTVEYWNTVNTNTDTGRDNPTAGSFVVAGRIGHIASWSHSATGITNSSMLTAPQAKYIDSKSDDGQPLSGKVFASEAGDASNCLNGTVYNSSDTTYCSQYIRMFLEE